jgi:hypothetical protein
MAPRVDGWGVVMGALPGSLVGRASVVHGAYEAQWAACGGERDTVALVCGGAVDHGWPSHRFDCP